MRYVFLVINPNVFPSWGDTCVTAFVFSMKYNTHVYFFHFDSSETYGSEQLKQTVMTGGECVLQEPCFREFAKKSFCSGSYSLCVFNSLPSLFFKQTRFSYIIFYSFMSFSLFMPCIFICCFLIAREGRQDAPLGTDGFLEIYQQGLLLE